MRLHLLTPNLNLSLFNLNQKKTGPFTEKNGFATATKLGTTDKIFVAATKNFSAATKRFVD